MNRDLSKDIRRATVQTMNPVWREEVNSRARSETDRLIIAKGARIAGGNPPKAVAASSRRKLSGGLVPVESWAGFEFGSERDRIRSYRRRNRSGSGTHRVTRHTMRQLPARTPKGRVGYAAFAEVGPRMVSLWISLIVKKTHDAFEGK